MSDNPFSNLEMPPVFGPITGNPLQKYYRIPGLHVKLPTKGVFMPPGSIEFSPAGDIPVFPMAAKDELLLKSPDALMSGAALEELIKSCVPAIKLPRLVSTADMDVLLLAIRAATYGDTMDLHATCPKCKTENEFTCLLPALLATMKTLDSDTTVRLNKDLLIHVRPYNLNNATVMAIASYEEARKLQSLEEQNPKPDSMTLNKEVTKSIQRINKLNLRMISDCIVKIEMPDQVVTDARAIDEFINNVAKPWVEKIDKKLKAINIKGIDKTVNIKCSNKECGHEWKTEVDFNPSNFFDAASST